MPGRLWCEWRKAETRRSASFSILAHSRDESAGTMKLRQTTRRSGRSNRIIAHPSVGDHWVHPWLNQHEEHSRKARPGGVFPKCSGFLPKCSRLLVQCFVVGFRRFPEPLGAGVSLKKFATKLCGHDAISAAHQNRDRA